MQVLATVGSLVTREAPGAVGISMNVIEIEGLRRSYRSRKGTFLALDGLDLEVPEGGVFGFLGPNGSGKTTTIRCLLGLVRPTSGRLRLLGGSVPNALPDVIGRVGAIVEGPALFPTMSGRENLRLLGAIDRISPRRVDEVLEEVGLASRGGDLVHKYSLGMRQRLALAAALLKDPALLVLDEPANGLDPAGIRDVRELMRRLASEGRTVFVSSHILAEIEQTCDRLAILSHGRAVVSGTLAEVMASAGTGGELVASIDDPTDARLDGAIVSLSAAGFSASREGRSLRVVNGTRSAAHVNRALAAEGYWAIELRHEERSLEELFLTVTSDADAAPPEVAHREPVEVSR